MIRSRFLLALIIAPALAIAAAFGRTVDLAVSALRDCMALFSPDPMRLATDGPVLPRSIVGASVDSAVLHSLRHEANVGRRAAARNT